MLHCLMPMNICGFDGKQHDGELKKDELDLASSPSL